MTTRTRLEIAMESRPMQDVGALTAAILGDWLARQAEAHGLRQALVHADDGVIWGVYAQGAWHWSSGQVPNSPPLRLATVQQMRLFGPMAEIFVWRDEAGLRGRLIVDGLGASVNTAYFDEVVKLERVEVPQVIDPSVEGLTVRNYVKPNEGDGRASVVACRLVAIIRETT